MTFDVKAPAALKRSQEWFASIITRPMDGQSRMNPISPRGMPMEQEAAQYLIPSPTLAPHLRIELYNQQYWWRLLNILQETFPLLTCLFGYIDFNHSIAIPYLVKHPPNHWSLSFIGYALSQWVEEEYNAEDKLLIKNVVEVDLAFGRSFFAERRPSIGVEMLSPEQEKSLLSKTLSLQPHLELLVLPYHLLKFRDEMVKESPDYWLEHDFPILEREQTSYHCVIYRNRHDHFSWELVSPTAFQILQLFKKGTNIDNVCEWIEQQSEEMIMEASTNLHLWFQEWTFRGWLEAH